MGLSGTCKREEQELGPAQRMGHFRAQVILRQPPAGDPTNHSCAQMLSCSGQGRVLDLEASQAM